MPWYEDYFTKEWMEFRDTEAMLEKARLEAGFLEQALRIAPPAKIIDIGCGFGRHALELALRGHNVTGIDLSPELLAQARKLSREKGIRATWRECDMRRMEFENEFDGAVCLFTSLGYFDSDEEDIDVLERTARALRRKGRFVLDVENRDGLLLHYIPRDWWRTRAGGLVMEERRFDPVTGRGHTKIVLAARGRIVEHDLDIRWYSVPELERMLRHAGLGIDRLYGGLDGSDFNADSMRLVIVGEKE